MPNADTQKLPSRFNYRFIGGTHGRLILRPWFDAVTLYGFAKWFCPLSRAWAAATVSAGSVKRFSHELSLSSLNLSQYSSTLKTVSQTNNNFHQICDDWEAAFFSHEKISQEKLVDHQMAIFKGERSQLAMRRHFLSLRPHLLNLNWDIATPDTVDRCQGQRLSEHAYPAPAVSNVTKSASLLGEWGEEFHLKITSPAGLAADSARAHVFMPKEGQVRGTIIFLHGLGLEPMMWDALAYPAKALTRRGIRVVLPTAPWHGRRTPDGQFGGQKILCRGPLGLIECFERWVAEAALWIRWSHSTTEASVGLGGVSLGALTAQIVATAANDWPKNDRPDSLMLVTTTADMKAVAFNSGLGEMLGYSKEIQHFGWTPEKLKRWLPLLQPGEKPAIKPEQIVMLLGSADRITPFEGGVALSKMWGVTDDNLFIRNQGHFSGGLGLSHDPGPLQRFADLLLQN